MSKLLTVTMVITLSLLAGCTSQSNPGTTHIKTIPGCKAAPVNIKIKLDTGNNIPALVNHGQNTVCVESGYKISWTLVETPGKDREFTIFFKDGSFNKTSSNGKLDFTKTTVTTITAYSYGIKIPGANDLDPIIIIAPTFSN